MPAAIKATGLRESFGDKLTGRENLILMADLHHLGKAEGTAAWLDPHSKNGVVRNALDAAEGPETADTVVEVHAHTDYGDIDIHRS